MADTFLVIGTGPTVNLVLGTDQTTNIVLSGAGPVYTAGTGIAISGANVISNTAPDQTVTMTDGTGIDVTGAYPNFTVTNTSPNVVQTLSIAGQDLTLSGGGGTVAIPGVSFPLLAPNGTVSAPSYSFTNSNESGVFYDGVLSFISAPSTNMLIQPGTEINGVSGPGSISVFGGDGDNKGGGRVTIQSGSSTNANGGKLNFRGGEGLVGGSFSMFGGTSVASGEKGGAVALNGGASTDGPGGDVTISGGAGTTEPGRIIFNSWGVEFVGIDMATRDLISSPNPGTTIFCTDATATDSSTGVMQVYNGTTWKNAW